MQKKSYDHFISAPILMLFIYLISQLSLCMNYRSFFSIAMANTVVDPIANKKTISVIRIRTGESTFDMRMNYDVALLRAALEATEKEFGPYEIQLVSGQGSLISKRAAFDQLKKNQIITVEPSLTSKELEREFEPARYPIHLGYSGMRIFITRTELKLSYQKIFELNQLAKVRIGSGFDWPDTQIMRSNGLKVVTHPNYKMLFSFLKEHKFELLSRAIYEPWSELRSFGNGSLEVEQSLFLHYPAANYYFFNKRNAALARRVEQGLSKLDKNGELERMLSTHLFWQVPKGLLKGRTRLELSNSDLPTTAPFGHLNWKDWWSHVSATASANKILFESGAAN